jgi:hypothetical protein
VNAQPSPRDPADWITDLTWHRRMFAQSRFRWAPEDPLAIALTWMSGRLVYEEPAHLHLVDSRLSALRGFSSQIDDAMLAPLREARRACTAAAWKSGLELVGLSPRAVEILRHGAPQTITPNAEAARALVGIPLPNPFSRIWELRQIRGMYTAAENILEDVFCDLSVELAPTHGWQRLSEFTHHHRSERTLQLRINHQRATRGAPGDPRRESLQRYCPAPPLGSGELPQLQAPAG